jgi:hypothetical protein
MSKQEKLKANVKYKDTLFKKLFGQNKENALSLYNAINGTNYTMYFVIFNSFNLNVQEFDSHNKGILLN